MTQQQIILFTLLVVMLALLAWGRWRYDLVAFGTLIAAVLLGVVQPERMFEGFAHPAVIIVALVLVVTKGLSNSGAVEMVARHVISEKRSLSAHVGIISTIAVALSSVMNNIAALALLMPLDIKAAEKAKRSPALTLMPLAFATIFGGLITLIGTPPNIIVASYREKETGVSFAMFDYAPVGLICAAVGLVFLTVIGWRLVPKERREHDMTQELAQLEEFVTEISVPAASPAIGKTLADLNTMPAGATIKARRIIRKGVRLAQASGNDTIAEGDVITVEATARDLNRFVEELQLQFAGAARDYGLLRSGTASLHQVVVPLGAEMEGQTARSIFLQEAHGIALLGVSRSSRKFRERVQDLKIEAGDILLLYGPRERLVGAAEWLGFILLADQEHPVINRRLAWAAIAMFGLAILLATLNFFPLTVSLSIAAGLMVMLNVIPVRQLYNTIDWPVVVLLGSLMPISGAVETSGGAELIGQTITASLPGAAPWQVLAVFLAMTMALANVLNNSATAVMTAPIAVVVAKSLGVSVDPFLMAVAVGSSCAFLTPIGTKVNTLILGPGGYRFGDYWLMGLPLSILVFLAAVPALLLAWPL